MARTDYAHNNMYERRKELKLTQKQAGEIIGVPRALYSRYEIGRTLPSVLAALDIAQAFGVSVEYLFGSQGDYCYRKEPKPKDPCRWTGGDIF